MQKHLRDQRRAAGLCVQCRRPSTNFRCEVCREKGKQAVSRSYKKRVAEGKCGTFGCVNQPHPGKVYCPKCAEGHRLRDQELNKAGLCIKCSQPVFPGSNMCEKHRETIAAQVRRRRDKQKLRVFEKYGGAKCAGCPETELVVLQLDHINGGGRKHLRQIGSGRLYDWVEENNYPPGFRVLCASCNVRAYRKVPFPNER